jgi:hypothetical protein
MVHVEIDTSVAAVVDVDRNKQKKYKKYQI